LQGARIGATEAGVGRLVQRSREVRGGEEGGGRRREREREREREGAGVARW
jgi:hypothetical protein